MTQKSEQKSIKEGIVFGLGNPLLDISATVDPEFLKKYGLSANDQILATDKHKNLCKEMMDKYKVEYLAGGSVQNTLRVMQWFFDKQPSIATFMGCVGDDDYHKKMEAKAKENRINAIYMVDKKEPTGTCACLITNGGKNRSLCAYLGASTKFNVNFLSDNYKNVEKAKYIFTSGYHLAASFESVLNLAKHCDKNKDKVFAFTLSAAYICHKFTKELHEIYPYIDYLFANETEALELSEVNGWSVQELKDTAKFMADKDVNKTTKKRDRTVIITQGTGPIMMAKTHKSDVKEFEIMRVPSEKIIDTNGAGDAFVGGFFAQLIQGQPIEVCVKSGSYAASEVIQNPGCNFPKENKFKI